LPVEPDREATGDFFRPIVNRPNQEPTISALATRAVCAAAKLNRFDRLHLTC
jgi:hypothetical protein